MADLQCREAEALISAMADREQVRPEDLATVREHCRTCVGCAAFASAVMRLRDIAPPEVPDGLEARVLDAVARERAAEEASEQAKPAGAVAAGTSTGAAAGTGDAGTPAGRLLSFPWLTRQRLWAGMAVVGTSAAALLLAVLINAQMAGTPASTEGEIRDALQRSFATQGGQGAPAETGKSEKGSTAPAVATQAPPFIAFMDKVYAPAASAGEIDPSTLTTAGSVYAAMSESGDAVAHFAYTRTNDRDLIVLMPDETYQAFTPVTRTFDGGTYQLTSGVDLPRYGVWPRLPSGLPEPTNAVGSPSFISAGADDRGIRVFVRVGSDSSTGIAVAPGSPPTDPAAGNPYWTWWARLP